MTDDFEAERRAAEQRASAPHAPHTPHPQRVPAPRTPADALAEEPAPGAQTGAPPAPGAAPEAVQQRDPGQQARTAPPAQAAPPAQQTRQAAPQAQAAHSPADSPAAAATPDEDPLLPLDERDKLATHVQQAVSRFVESPRRAVEEADSAFDMAVRHLTDALAERQLRLRAGWRGQDTQAETEELRMALQQYRQITDRLLRM